MTLSGTAGSSKQQRVSFGPDLRIYTETKYRGRLRAQSADCGDGRVGLISCSQWLSAAKTPVRCRHSTIHLSLSHATHSSQRVWNWWLGRGHEAYVHDNLGTATDRCALSKRQLDRIRWNWEEDRHMPPPQPYQPICPRPHHMAFSIPPCISKIRSLSALDFNPVHLASLRHISS